jgi:hypothetical protein
MIVRKKNSLKGRVSIKLKNLMIRLTHTLCVWTSGIEKMKLKTEVEIKNQGSNNKKPQNFGGVWPFTNWCTHEIQSINIIPDQICSKVMIINFTKLMFAFIRIQSNCHNTLSSKPYLPTIKLKSFLLSCKGCSIHNMSKIGRDWKVFSHGVVDMKSEVIIAWNIHLSTTNQRT